MCWAYDLKEPAAGDDAGRGEDCLSAAAVATDDALLSAAAATADDGFSQAP